MTPSRPDNRLIVPVYEYGIPHQSSTLYAAEAPAEWIHRIVDPDELSRVHRGAATERPVIGPYGIFEERIVVYTARNVSRLRGMLRRGGADVTRISVDWETAKSWTETRPFTGERGDVPLALVGADGQLRLLKRWKHVDLDRPLHVTDLITPGAAARWKRDREMDLSPDEAVRNQVADALHERSEDGDVFDMLIDILGAVLDADDEPAGETLSHQKRDADQSPRT
jgi:hypothetical protein